MNIQKPDELNMENNRIEIYDKDNNLLKVIEPYAVESCMNPGIFKITPIKIEKTKDSIIFISENIKTEIKKQDIESTGIQYQLMSISCICIRYTFNLINNYLRILNSPISPSSEVADAVNSSLIADVCCAAAELV